jgi:hypothetical protein
MSDSIIMAKVKHSFTPMSKHCLLVYQAGEDQHKAMLKEDETEKERMAIAGRLREILQVAGRKTAIAKECKVSDQAVTGWIKTGRIDKKHLPIIAKMSGKTVDWILTGQNAAQITTDRPAGQEEGGIEPATSLTEDQRRALDYVDGLSPSQRVEWFRWAEARQQDNQEVIEHVGPRLTRKGKRSG